MKSITTLIALATAASSFGITAAPAPTVDAHGGPAQVSSEQQVRWEAGHAVVSTGHMIEGEAPYGADARDIELTVSYGPDGPYLTGSVTYLECPPEGEQCSPVGEEAHIYGDGSTVTVDWKKNARGITAVGTADVMVGWETVDTLDVDLWTEPVGKASRTKDGNRTTITRDQLVHGTVGGYPVSNINTEHVHTINRG